MNTSTPPPPSRPSIIMSGPHFSKALHKLHHYGVTGRTNECIKSWLCYRQQRVVLDGSTSPDFGVTIYCNLDVKIFCILSKMSPAIVRFPIVLVSSGFDGSSTPLLMFSIGIYILPLISKLLSACCDIFVHCALSLIILFYTVFYMCML